MKRPGNNTTATSVAKLAGISQPTVSRAFRNPSLVKKSTLIKIQEAANKLNYCPNYMASSLASKTSNLIGIIVKDFKNPFYSSFVYQITNELNKIGKHVLLFSDTDSCKILDVLNEARSYNISGLIIASTSLSRQLEENNIPAEIPIVMINRQESSKYYCSVASDDIESGRLAADFFIKKGIRSFAFISGPETTPSSEQRKAGYTNRLIEWGLNNQLIIEKGAFTYISGYDAMNRIIDSHPTLPMGILCANDLMGLGAIDAIKNTNIYKIPKDFSLIGFDNIDESHWSSYNLSSMQLPTKQMIQTAFNYLINYENDPMVYSGKHLFSCTLIERGSTK